jgi:hypothetical protein
VADEDDELQEALSAEEILTFGPCVEAQVWTPTWVQERRAPIAVAAGRPKLGKVFDDQGVGKMVTIRPCMSRGRRVRGLSPVYTPRMLESNAGVFNGWPMFLDHAPPELAKTLAKYGRSVRELGGQVLKGGWDRDFVQEDDANYGYQKGGVIAEVWATPLVRKTVGENPNLLHTSINAWPTSGKPGPVPWRAGQKGMIIEGIRRQPQGSVDYVVRGGAGGKLLIAEGLEEEGAWPEVGEWSSDDVRLVVSLAESLYASPHMSDIALPTKPDELREWMQEHAPHLLPALAESSDSGAGSAGEEVKRKRGAKKNDDDGDADDMKEGLTEADVRRIMQESSSDMPTVEEFEQRLREQTERTIAERDEQRELSTIAHRLIESAVGIPPKWKVDLQARYSMLPEGPPASLQIAESEQRDADGKELTAQQVLEARVEADLDHVRDLIAEATGKPRVKGEGAKRSDAGEDRTRTASTRRKAQPYWRQRFVNMGLAESEDKAVEAFGGKVEG